MPLAMHAERSYLEEVRALRLVAGTSPGMPANARGVYAKAPPTLLAGGRKA